MSNPLNKNPFFNAQLATWVKISVSKNIYGIIEAFFYERRVYESEDDRSLY